jgi:hypothetical protein
MSYWKKTSGKNYQSLDKFDNSSKGQVNNNEFYELEPAVVLDVVMDETHKIFQNKEFTKIDFDRSPSDVEGKKPLPDDVDYSWVGRALVRTIFTQNKVEKEQLVWAFPLESNINEYPLINEVVIVVKYLDQVFYTRKLNQFNHVHSNEKFGLEQLFGGFIQNGIQKGNRELNEPNTEFKGPSSKSRHDGGYGFEGVVGRYFWINKNIRAIKRFEGDLVIESRFGQSIRFATYDNKRENDTGFKEYKDYYNEIDNPFTKKPTGGGNPMIVIRNRQRPILKEGQEYKSHKKLPSVKGTKIEKNVGGYIEEDINNDGSTIAITSGQTITKWVTTCYKQMWEEKKEEQESFSPTGCSTFKFPTLDKDQIVINTDRIILSSRLAETFMYSKKRFGIVTDSEFTVDSHDQLILNTNQKTVINSPAIYLGEYNVTDEPVLLGQTTVNWLYELCNWLLTHTHWHKHSHVDAGKESPSQTQLPVQQQILISLRDKLHTLMSRRVFVTGGGLAAGKDGGQIQDGKDPVKIDTKSGSGVPGGFKGKNYRPS